MVQKYHKWMQDPVLLELTASEPLTLEEEYDNQVSWLTDLSKYTFIVFEKVEDKTFREEELPELCRGGSFSSCIMVGDINLFLHKYFDDNEAEIDIMIAEDHAKRKGIATQAVKMMINFGFQELKRNKILAKIKDTNNASIKLFESLGFKKVKELPQFEEVHYELLIDPSLKEKPFSDLNEQRTSLQITV